MKKITTFFILLTSYFLAAQCSYDESCTISPAFPNICPMQLPDATAGEFYSTDLTFWMPTQFEAEGFEVELTELAVSQIAGFPIGLDVELSNPSMVFYPSESEFGCASVSGVPFSAGDYVITVYVVANVTVAAVGFEIAYPTEFNLFLTVNPGSGGNNSFTYSPTNGCEDLEVVFEALVESEDFDVEYNWDFGNGNFSYSQSSTQIFEESGDYNVTLTTNLTTNEIILENFSISDVSVDCYGGDFEEYCWDLWLIGSGCWSDPDLYLKIFDANNNLIYQTGGIGSGEYITGTSASWSNINLSLINPPYTVEIWDTEAWDILDGLEDLIGIPLDVQVSDDDLLGTYEINLEDGNHSFSSGCSSGNYSISSSIVPVSTITNSETISVFDVPEVNTLLIEGEYSVYVELDNITSYQWFLDGSFLDGATESSFDVEISGTYHVEFITENGCFGMSVPLYVVKCADYNPNVISLGFSLSSSIDELLYSYNWFFNDSPFGSGSSVSVSSEGYYFFIMNDESGCSWISETIFYQPPPSDTDNDGINDEFDDDLDGDGIVNSEDDDVDGDGIPDEIDDDIDGDGIDNDNDDSISGYLALENINIYEFNVFPNPSNGIINISFPNLVSEKLVNIEIIDLSGQLLFNNTSMTKKITLDLSKLPPAYYILKLNIDDNQIYKRIYIN